MAQENIAPISEFEQFMAREMTHALWNADFLLTIASRSTTKEEYLRLAGPLFSSLTMLEKEITGLNLEMRVSLWTPDTHEPRATPAPARRLQSLNERDDECFGVELKSLRDSLSIAGPLFE